MNNLSKLFSLIILICISSQLYAQEGTIRGKVVSAKTGESILSAYVIVKGTSMGVATDIEGKFELQLTPGTYDIELSFITFATKTIKDVVVKSDKITVLGSIELNNSTIELQEMVVTAEAVYNHELAFVNKMEKSIQILSGISSEVIGEMGVSQASGALKTVTGVTVEGGKYVHVRGVGDRYTDVMLNSITIPSLAPNKNTVPIDLFPTSLISNIVVAKTAVASLPADFAGGVVNIKLKDFPSRPVRQISASIGYNPSMHFNHKFLTYKGGDLDFLGYGMHARTLPVGARKKQIPTPITENSQKSVYNFVNSFNSTLAPYKKMNMPDYSIGLSLGNQYDVKNGNNLGYIFSLNYRKSSNHYNNYKIGEYQKQIDPDKYGLIFANRKIGTVSKSDVFLAGLAGIAYKNQFTKIQLTGLRLQNGVSRAAEFSVVNSQSAPGQSGYKAKSYRVAYSQRSITNILLHGTHYLDGTGWNIDWKISPTFSNIVDPDLRKTTFTLGKIGGNTTYDFISGAGGFPSRSWRFMNELNMVGRLDITKDYSLLGYNAELKFGSSYVYKNRNYEILKYGMEFFGAQPEYLNGDPSVVLNDKYIYGNDVDNKQGTIYYSSSNPVPNPNAYQSNSNKISLYLSSLFNPTPKLSMYMGLRLENYTLRHTGHSQSVISLNNETVLESTKLFPSTNFKYSLTDKMYLRLAYYKTLARPTFKEMSFAQILNPISDRIFNGGLFAIGDWDGNLRETNIHNVDLGWQYYLGKGQLLSVTTFYKSFDAPIELVRILNSTTSIQIQPRNVGSGRILGLELQIKKSLGFISSNFSNLKFNGNFSFIKSTIEMTEQEYNARLKYTKEGQVIDNKRTMAGQAPYVINAGLNYENSDLGLNTGFYYNVKGETLIIVGGGIFPDIYSQPYHSLSFNLSKSFGKATVSLSIENIFNDSHYETFKAFKAQEETYKYHSEGRTIGIGFNYRF